MKIANELNSMVQLWLRLERTEEDFRGNYRRFCPRAVLRQWFADRATDDFIWTVCTLSELEGYEELPDVSLCPRKHRELLRAIIAVTLGIGMRKVNLRALDRAFSIAFPKATRINVNKKK